MVSKQAVDWSIKWIRNALFRTLYTATRVDPEVEDIFGGATVISL